MKKDSSGLALWVWTIVGIAASLIIAAVVVRAVAVERTSKARPWPELPGSETSPLDATLK